MDIIPTRTFLITTLLWLVCGPLQAGEIATYRVLGTPGETTLTIYYGDPWHVRVDTLMAGKPVNSIRLIDKKVYLLSQGQVIDLERLRGLGGKGAPTPPAGGLPAGIDTVARIRNTGRKTRVAGIEGEVFEIRYASGRHDQAVLSRDSHLRALQLGWRQLGQHLGQAMGHGGFATLTLRFKDPKLKQYALLRYAGSLELLRLESGPIPDSVFSLPRQP